MASNQIVTQDEKRKLLNAKNIADTVLFEELPDGFLNEFPVAGKACCDVVGAGMGPAIGTTEVGTLTGNKTGPTGTVVGTDNEGVAEGMPGKEATVSVNFSVELAYWEEHFSSRPYHRQGQPFDYYRPAYQIGMESFDANGSFSWEKREPALKKKWEDPVRQEGEGDAPTMTWEEAKQMAKDAHDRLVGISDTIDEIPESRPLSYR